MKIQSILKGQIEPFWKGHLRSGKTLIFLFILVTLLSSCYKEPWYGKDGRPGNAYLAVDWVDDEPDYIDVGTSAVPPYFYWGEYYRAYPGIYQLYYEGEVWMGNRWAFYAWEIDYEIWRNEGEQGGAYYHGRDGADTYFTLECSPFGPLVYEDYKSGDTKPGFEVLQDSDDEITILKTDKDFNLKITYRKVEQRVNK